MTRNPQSRARFEAYLALVFLALFWGYSWVAMKVATRDASPISVAAMRAALGAAALLAFLVGTRRPLRPTRFAPTLVFGLLQTTVLGILQAASVAAGSAGKSAILTYTMPLWLSLLAWPLLGERFGPVRWLALGLAAAGLGFIVLPLSSATLAGNLLPVAAGLVWAVSAVWAVRIRRREEYDLLSLTTWQMVYGAAALLPVALVAPGEVHWSASLAASLGYLATFGTAVCWALWLFVLSRLPASAAGMGSLAVPLVGLVLAAIQLREMPSLGEAVGMASIVLALVLNARATGSSRDTAPAGSTRP
jgi:drug/metabolite transporter (DMT)-like permease